MLTQMNIHYYKIIFDRLDFIIFNRAVLTSKF